VIPGVAPITPLTSILPLLFVLSVTAIKDAWDDWVHQPSHHVVYSTHANTSAFFLFCFVLFCFGLLQNRRKADNEVNNRTASIGERDVARDSVTWRDVAYKVRPPIIIQIKKQSN
jgi:hypothetical protein